MVNRVTTRGAGLEGQPRQSTNPAIPQKFAITAQGSGRCLAAWAGTLPRHYLQGTSLCPRILLRRCGNSSRLAAIEVATSSTCATNTVTPAGQRLDKPRFSAESLQSTTQLFDGHVQSP